MMMCAHGAVVPLNLLPTHFFSALGCLMFGVERGCVEMCTGASSMTMCELVESWRMLDRKKVIRGTFLAWCLWCERNCWVFQQQCTPNKILVDQVTKLVDEYGSNTAYVYSHVVAAFRPSAKTWQPPPPHQA